MGKWKIKANGKTVPRHAIPPGQQWTWWTIEMVRSPAFRALSVSAHRVIARIRIELADHGGQDNGKLPVTHRDFHEYGIHWDAISPAIREAEALGWIRITEHGMASAGEFRKPTLFALTHMPAWNAMVTVGTNDWNKIGSLQEAEAIAKAARKQPARHDRLSRKKRRQPENFSAPETGSASAPETGSAACVIPLRKPEH